MRDSGGVVRLRRHRLEMHAAEEQLDAGVIGRSIHEHVIDLVHDSRLLGGEDGVEETPLGF